MQGGKGGGRRGHHVGTQKTVNIPKRAMNLDYFQKDDSS
jgi:hypothetical protein